MIAKYYIFILILFLLFTFRARAQYLSIKKNFQIDQQLGCHNLTVKITNLNSGTGTIIYQFNGSGSAATTNPVHTYTTPGIYWINQFIQGATGKKKDSISVVVVTPKIPDIKLLSCNNLGLIVQINDTYYDAYKINYGDGTILTFPKGIAIPRYTYTNNTPKIVSVTGLFTTATNQCATKSTHFNPTASILPAQIDSLIVLNNTTLKLDYKLPKHTINKLEISINNNKNFVPLKKLEQRTTSNILSNLNLTKNTYCFKIITYDACSNSMLYSNEICSINLSVSARNNQILINWKSFNFDANQTTNIKRNGKLLQSLTTPLMQYIDLSSVCNTTYCYQIETHYLKGISQSLIACKKAYSNKLPPTINNISSITNSNSIKWTWQVPLNTTPAHYYVRKVLKNGNLVSTKSVTTNFVKNELKKAPQFISVQLVDICNNKSRPSTIASSLFLEGKMNESFDIQLNWNNVLGWIDGFQGYYITIHNKKGLLIDSIYTANNTSYLMPLANQINQNLTFTVWAIPILDGIKFTRSNKLNFKLEPIIGIPTSFSPNGDGLNDKFIITGKFMKSYEMQIFNRWGEILFNTTNLNNGWDGTSKGKKMKTDNYIYQIRIKDLDNNEHIRTGSVLILSN